MNLRAPSRKAALLAMVLCAGCSGGGSSSRSGPGATGSSFDGRRTSQFAVTGPSSVSAQQLARTEIGDGLSLNMPVTVSEDGTVYAGTWGVLRSLGSVDRRDWDKLDGKVFAFHPDLSPAWPAPFAPPRVPFCYDHAGREDPERCPTGGAGTWLAGTVEGRPALRNGVLYAGRGDGSLYALDASTGQQRWRFQTYDPSDRDDPDGGGEVIAAPWVDDQGVVYVGSYGVGPFETNAVYAINPDGTERWRYPSADRTVDSSFVALATSPDGRRLYAAGFWRHDDDGSYSPFPASMVPQDGAVWEKPGQLFAFDLDQAGGSGEQHLAWSIELRDSHGFSFGATALAVGSDGTLYVGGSSASIGYHAQAMAFRDLGTTAELAWPASVPVDGEHAAYAYGLALREEQGQTERVYVASGNNNAIAGGKLVALAPADGATLWTFDPEAQGAVGSLNGIALDRRGVAYVSAHGRDDTGGYVLAVGPDGDLELSFTVDQPIDWGTPVLGPEGNLYVGGSLRDQPCPMLVPIDLGLCIDAAPNPALFVLRPRP